MHELGIMYNIVETVEKFAEQNQISTIDTLVLQVGEMASVIPKYLEACYEPAIDGTKLCDTKLKIEVMPANGICNNCKAVFNVPTEKGVCPKCRSNDFELLTGKEFFIKEIIGC